jgi:pimeloyl-ACP methyl ester carboxylesterase
MPTIETRDGTKLYVKDWGSGPAVVLIHGWPLSSDSWDPQAFALANAGYRVIAYDRRGFGRSEQPWSGYDYDTLSDDLADVMEACGVTSGATLVGFSMGGGEVARYMSRHQGKSVAKAVLVGSVVPYLLQTDDNPDGVAKSQLEDMAKQMQEDRPKFMANFLDQFFGVGFITSPVSEERLHWAWSLTQQAGLKPTLACAEAFAFTDFRPDLAAFTVPTLIIHGTSDSTVPIDATGRAAAAAIPGAKLIEYDGAPHGLFATDQDRLTDDLLAFLGDPVATPHGSSTS